VPLGLVEVVGPFVHTRLLLPVDNLEDAGGPRCCVDVGFVEPMPPA